MRRNGDSVSPPMRRAACHRDGPTRAEGVTGLTTGVNLTQQDKKGALWAGGNKHTVIHKTGADRQKERKFHFSVFKWMRLLSSELCSHSCMAVTAVNAMRHSADLASPSARETPRGSPTCSAHLHMLLCLIYHISKHCKSTDLYIPGITDSCMVNPGLYGWFMAVLSVLYLFSAMGFVRKNWLLDLPNIVSVSHIFNVVC